MANTIITQGIKLSELAANGYLTDIVAADDLILLATASGTKVIKVSDFLKTVNWSAATNTLGAITNKPTNLATTDTAQTIKNKTFEGCKETPPTSITLLPEANSIFNTANLDKSNSFVFNVSANCTLALPTASSVAMQTFLFMVSLANTAGLTFSFTTTDTIKTGDAPLEFQVGKMHTITAFSDGAVWYLSQGKTY